MTDPEKMKPSLPDRDPEGVDQVPSEEEVTGADVERRIDLDPEEQPNRPDQADFDPEEREQYEDPPTVT